MSILPSKAHYIYVYIEYTHIEYIHKDTHIHTNIRCREIDPCSWAFPGASSHTTWPSMSVAAAGVAVLCAQRRLGWAAGLPWCVVIEPNPDSHVGMGKVLVNLWDMTMNLDHIIGFSQFFPLSHVSEAWAPSNMLVKPQPAWFIHKWSSPNLGFSSNLIKKDSWPAGFFAPLQQHPAT